MSKEQIDAVMTRVVSEMNAQLPEGFALVEAQCPECSSKDVNLKAGLPLGQQQCWDCGCIYAFGGG